MTDGKTTDLNNEPKANSVAFNKTEQQLQGRWPSTLTEEGLAKIAVGRLLQTQSLTRRPELRYEQLERGRFGPVGGFSIFALIPLFMTLPLFVFAYVTLPPNIEHPVEVVGVVIDNVLETDADDDDRYYSIIEYETYNGTHEIRSTYGNDRPLDLGTERTVRYEETTPQTAYIVGDRSKWKSAIPAALGALVLLGWVGWYSLRILGRRTGTRLVQEGKRLVEQSGSDPRLPTAMSFTTYDYEPLVALVGPTLTDVDGDSARLRHASAMIPVSGPIPIDVFIPTGAYLPLPDGSDRSG